VELLNVPLAHDVAIRERARLASEAPAQLTIEQTFGTGAAACWKHASTRLLVLVGDCDIHSARPPAARMGAHSRE
jgi:hypothetical protein